jgi:hypothetical protein
MAKAIVVEHQGVVSSFAFNKIDRTRLYGRRRRVPLDPEGKPCTRASLTVDDSSLLLRSGMTAQGYFDEELRWIPSKELVGIDAAGMPLEVKASTLGEAVALEGPIEPTELLDVRVSAVYVLWPEELGKELREELESGKIYRFPFNYRPGWDVGAAYLVANEKGDFFALTGERWTPDWAAPNALLEPLGDDEDFGDELDFEMF